MTKKGKQVVESKKNPIGKRIHNAAVDQRDDIAENTKQRLEEQFQKVDPMLLLKHIRDAQAVVMALSQNTTPPPLSEDMQKFVSGLAIAWNSGEVRPTHRREPRPGRWYRTRKDPFTEVWPVLLGWLEEKPDIEAKEMLKRLQASGYGNYSDGQLRTLQRRVREWRTRMARDLIYDQDSVEVETGAGEEGSVFLAWFAVGMADIYTARFRIITIICYFDGYGRSEHTNAIRHPPATAPRSESLCCSSQTS
jgi:hypothetical protein